MKSPVPKNDTTLHAYGVDDECLAPLPNPIPGAGNFKASPLCNSWRAAKSCLKNGSTPAFGRRGLASGLRTTESCKQQLTGQCRRRTQCLSCLCFLEATLVRVSEPSLMAATHRTRMLVRRPALFRALWPSAVSRWPTRPQTSNGPADSSVQCPVR